MKTYRIALLAFLLTLAISAAAQSVKVKGKVLGQNNTPVTDAMVSISGIDSTLMTDENGEFEVSINSKQAIIQVAAIGYYPLRQSLANRSELKILLIPESKTAYNEEHLLPINGKETGSMSSSVNITKKDFGAENKIENALQGKVSGLLMTEKSGMPNEGAYFNLRGIRSLVANNQPLIVVDGIPYLPDTEESPLISGFSRDMFSSFNLHDIANITVLKGANTSIYGSLGANGVILIETDGATSEDLNTRISFSGQYGMKWNNKNIPLLNRNDYRSYLNDIGMTYYSNMADLQSRFPFLKDDPDDYYSYQYAEDTDWQDKIYKPSFVTDNILRIEGGDAIAKYDIAIGYMKDAGIIENTSSNRYHTQINTNITVSRKFEIFSTVRLAYSNSDLMEQGMIQQTNPALAAYAYGPVYNAYLTEKDGTQRPTFNGIKNGYSNPLAITKTLVAKSKLYDINARIGLKYIPTDYLSFSGTVGLLYNYSNENEFIPGVTLGAIAPLSDGLAKNTARSGVGEVFNMFYNVNATYNKTFNTIHDFTASLGTQIITSRKEYDAGSGYNTANDYYQTLGYVTSESRKFSGYIDLWNWMNFYAQASYTYNNLVKISANVALDAASSVGENATRFSTYPSVGVTLMTKNSTWLVNSSLINRLDLRAEYGLTGNSRFSSNLGKNYYVSSHYMELSGIVRSSVPNTKLKAEVNKQLNLGIDISLFNNRLDLSFDYYNAKVEDIVFAQPASSSVYGAATYYNNAAKIDNNGIEISLRTALVQTKNFDWVVGGNIAFRNSKVKSLGEITENITKLSDGSEIITRVGENPYAFYGYKTKGILTTQTEANVANLTNSSGNPFNAGDVHFVDQNNDHIIDDQDKIVLGSAEPDYFGGFYTSFRYKNWSLSAEFIYSQGNEAYNAVRRANESMSSWANQSKAATNRWQFDGHQTNMPKANYGDPMENSRFSNRWIEDASYLKLKNVTLGYTVNRPILKFIRSAHFYVSGENLHTWTKYLGLDPEFAYSYDEAIQGVDFAKAILPMSVRFGFNLKF